MEQLSEAFQNLVTYFQYVSIFDVIDIIIVAFLIYKLISLIRNTTAAQVMIGIALIAVFLGVSTLLQLQVVSFFIRAAMQMGIFAIVVVFQPELRKLLETVGASSLSRIINKDTRDATHIENVIKQVVTTCNVLAQQRVGALIVFERNVFLSDIIKSGTGLDAEVSSMLIKNLFFPNAALHDGALIIREGRIIAAGCMLPLTNNNNLSKDLGTRHRAAVGVSEKSDAVVVVVSEETGSISLAVAGLLKRHLNTETLTVLLRNELIASGEETAGGGLLAGIKKVFSKKEKQ